MTRTPLRRAATVVVAALLGVCVAWAIAPRGTPSALEQVPRTTPTSTIGSDPQDDAAAPARGGSGVRARPATLSAANRAARVSAAPTRLSLPRLGLSLPVRPTGVDAEGLMALPETAYAVGWYRYGRGPLDPAGATVVAGHVDTDAEGTGPLARLASVRPGDLVTLQVSGRQVRYRVVGVERVAKSVLDLPALFDRSGPPRLHLVTCGGAYLADRGGYQDNVVVTARPW